MIQYKTIEDIELIRKSALLVSKTLAEIGKCIKPGVIPLDLDRLADAFIRDHGGIPGFKGYGGFPNTLCVSINEVVVHGIPNKEPLKNGDIVSVDCGVLMNGFYGDSAYTFAVGEISEEKKKLLNVTKECLVKGIEKALFGLRLGDIGFVIQEHAEKHGYSVNRELVGHGIGRKLHEQPNVPNYGKQGFGIKLQKGLVIAIEPMIHMGKQHVHLASDKWAVYTQDAKPAAHFEHTVAISDEGKADVLSTFEFIEQVLSK